MVWRVAWEVVTRLPSVCSLENVLLLIIALLNPRCPALQATHRTVDRLLYHLQLSLPSKRI